MLIHLDNEWFLKIKNETKTIEVRLYDEKRKTISIGDIITFKNRLDDEIIECKVINLHIDSSFDELFDNINIAKCGFNNKDDGISILEKYYSKDDQNKFGVVGIEIKLIK